MALQAGSLGNNRVVAIAVDGSLYSENAHFPSTPIDL